MTPFSNRIVTPGDVGLMLMLQLRMACAERLASLNVSVNAVFRSTLVMGVLSIAPLMLEGLVRLLEGCSYSAMIAFQQCVSFYFIAVMGSEDIPKPEDKGRCVKLTRSSVTHATGCGNATYRSSSAPPPSAGSKIRCVVGMSCGMSVNILISMS